MPYKRIDLPFAPDALEPYIDTETIKVHYDGHHKAYEDKLNKAIAGSVLENKFQTIEELMKKYQSIEDANIRIAIREFGGGLINHNFFWQMLEKNVEWQDGNLKNEVIKTWGSIEEFKKALLGDCLSLFGSGWVWLVKRKNGALKIIKTFNQDNPWFLGFFPIIGIDLWEHSYYLKHRGNRSTYFEDIWHVINWNFCEEKYNEIV